MAPNSAGPSAARVLQRHRCFLHGVIILYNFIHRWLHSKWPTGCQLISPHFECYVTWYFSVMTHNVQYIPRNMHTVFALLCFVMVIHGLIFPYPSGLIHWHCGNLTIAPVPSKQPWWIWINTSCEFIMNDCITTTKQSTTKPCAYFLEYTVHLWGSHHTRGGSTYCLHITICCWTKSFTIMIILACHAAVGEAVVPFRNVRTCNQGGLTGFNFMHVSTIPSNVRRYNVI